MKKLSLVTLTAMLALLAPVARAAPPAIVVERHKPANLFRPDETVRFDARTTALPAGKVSAVVKDYFGKDVWSGKLPAGAAMAVEVGPLGPGYYEMTLSAGDVRNTTSFGVAPFVTRSAEEVRKHPYRFGLKKWNFGTPTWRKDVGEWSEDEVVDASAKLGLQWTREMFNQRTHLGIVEMTQRYPMNTILKVERFPKELYDADRYGPLAEWEVKFGKGSWTLKSLPKEGPYKEWLRSEIEQIPAEQNVFEIWNEAWDKMSPEDFATISQWIVEVIQAVRPGAIIGPNLLGDTSPYQFDARVIKAGGMKGMKMVALHPYGTSEDRQWLRDYKRWLHDQLGHDVDIYVTEFGSHSTPQGPAKRSEQEQAQRVVRQALALYAEDVKAFTPHWMGQTEQNPTYIEDWFGFFRLSHEPKPVLLAYATAARMIDGSRFVGDLWYGPGSDAMLFEANGVHTLALVTRGETKTIEVNTGVDAVDVVNAVGGTRRCETESGKLSIAIGPDATYLVGVSPKLTTQATTELNPTRWPKPAKPERVTRIAAKVKTAPAFDGSSTGWDELTQIAMLNPKVNGDDASGMGYLGWDERYLYVSVVMRDNEMLNNKPRAKLYQHDSVELFVSTAPRDSGAGHGPDDHQFFLTPTSGEGKPIAGSVEDPEAGIVRDVDGAKFYAGKVGRGWQLQAAIPWSTLGTFKTTEGAKIAVDLRVNDADTSHERFKIDPAEQTVSPSDPSRWAYLVLGPGK